VGGYHDDEAALIENMQKHLGTTDPNEDAGLYFYPHCTTNPRSYWTPLFPPLPTALQTPAPTEHPSFLPSPTALQTPAPTEHPLSLLLIAL